MTSRPPNIFELLACDRLKDGLREAFRYLLEYSNQTGLLGQYPIPKPDELVFLLDLLIEYNHLRIYNASYAENLYNLVRYSSRPERQKAKLLPSLVCLTLIPYLKRKLDDYVEKLNYKENRTANDLKKIRVYRLLSKSGSFLNLICMLRYTTGQSAYHNIADYLIGVTLISRTENVDENCNLSTLDLTSKRIADLLGKGLTIGSYIIQFLDYWNTHSNSSPIFKASLPIPQPPSKDGLAYTDERSSNICLICEHVRQNECTLSNTGFVFCYSCIHKYVKMKQRCPVTGQVATLDNIVKLCSQ